jgi:hypothetical protein
VTAWPYPVIGVIVIGWIAWGVRLMRRNNQDKLAVLRRLDGKRVRLNLRIGNIWVMSEAGTLRVPPHEPTEVILESETEKTHVVPLGQVAAVFRGRSCVASWDS